MAARAPQANFIGTARPAKATMEAAVVSQFIPAQTGMARLFGGGGVRPGAATLLDDRVRAMLPLPAMPAQMSQGGW